MAYVSNVTIVYRESVTIETVYNSLPLFILCILLRVKYSDANDRCQING